VNSFSTDLVGLLEASGAFPGASRLELDEIAAEGCELEIDAGRLLALPSVPVEDLLVVVDGHATRTDGGEREELGPGAVIGAELLAGQDTTTATVEATSAMRLASIPLRRLRELGWGVA
jgi:CRP-like cAMP-binding protein